VREVRIKGLGMGNWASSMGLLGLFLSALFPRFLQATEDGRRSSRARCLAVVGREDDRGSVVLLRR